MGYAVAFRLCLVVQYRALAGTAAKLRMYSRQRCVTPSPISRHSLRCSLTIANHGFRLADVSTAFI